jgi:cation:H+ antiporter
LFVYRSARLEPSDVREELSAAGESRAHPPGVAWRLVAGLAGLVGGAELMVRSGAAFARNLGVSELVIGLTIVAVGTSLPELASSLLAATRRQGDIAAGNVLGSNIFNVLLILGLTIIIHPIAVPRAVLYADLPVMLVFSIALMLVMRSSLRITRAEGVLLLCAYVIFTLLQSTRPG